MLKTFHRNSFHLFPAHITYHISPHNLEAQRPDHPVVIDRCWAWHAGYSPSGDAVGNGNGFKLGGGGSSGGAAFDQSVGAHVVTNCVAFENLHKGFDQNNAYEGMWHTRHRLHSCTENDGDSMAQMKKAVL